MDESTRKFEEDCSRHLDRFFAHYPKSVDLERAYRALRLLRAAEKPLRGKPEGWAAGIIYFVATDGRISCGVPEVLNAEFSEFMGVAMETARRRAARVRDIVLL